MNWLGILITLIVGGLIGYWIAAARNNQGANVQGDNGGRNRNDQTIVRQKPASVPVFSAETGTIGETEEQNAQFGYQSPAKPAYSSAAVFVKEQVQQKGSTAHQSQTDLQQQSNIQYPNYDNKSEGHLPNTASQQMQQSTEEHPMYLNQAPAEVQSHSQTNEDHK